MGARATGSATEAPRKPSGKRKSYVAVTIVVLIVVAAIAGSSLLGKKAASSSSTLGTSSQTPGITQVISLSNASAPFTLKPATVLIFPLPEPVGRLNPHVLGNFTVLSGGAVTTVLTTTTSPGVGAVTFTTTVTAQSGAVEVRVMNQSSYDAFVAAFHPTTGTNNTANPTNTGGENVGSFYNSGSLTSGSFNTTLPAAPDTYYLVFANRSNLNTIILAAQVNLVWQLPASG